MPVLERVRVWMGLWMLTAVGLHALLWPWWHPGH